MKICGIDVGGTSLKAAVVDAKKGTISGKTVRIETGLDTNVAKLVRSIRQALDALSWDGPVGVGFPGVVRHGRVFTAANLNKKFVGCDLQAVLERETGQGVRVLNDADAAGLAEVRFGVGRGFEGTIMVLTLGTGIGSALFCDGHLYANSEFGHLPIKGRSAEKLVAASVRTQRNLSWKAWGGRLNNYINIMETVLAPELIILGGGVSENYDNFRKYIITEARIEPALLRNGAGIIGAAVGFLALRGVEPSKKHRAVRPPAK